MKSALITLMCMCTASVPLFVQTEISLKADERIVATEVLVYEDIVLAALRTKPVFTRSENADILIKARLNAAKVTEGYSLFLSIDADIFNEIIYLKRDGGEDGEKIFELARKMSEREKAVLDTISDYGYK